MGVLRSSSKIMKRHPGGSRSLKRSVRKRSATIIEHKPGPRGGETKYRFPMPDKAHAQKAMQLLPKAKGLTPEEKKRIARRAMKFLGVTPSIARILGIKEKKKK